MDAPKRYWRPRESAGKTTTARRVGATIARLDRPAVAEAVRADPDAALTAYDPPVVIDEWQLVPEVLGAVKRSIDDDASAGRFILTGSTSADVTVAGWPATGRVVRIPMWGLSERELVSDVEAPPFMSRLLADGIDGVSVPPVVPDLRGYVERALRGGYPEVARQQRAQQEHQSTSRSTTRPGSIGSQQPHTTIFCRPCS